jgi:hypothetical protein
MAVVAVASKTVLLDIGITVSIKKKGGGETADPLFASATNTEITVRGTS